MKNVISRISGVTLACGLVLAGVHACGDDSKDEPTKMEPTRGGGDLGVKTTPTPPPTTRPTIAPTAGPTVGPTVEPTLVPTGGPGADPTIAPPEGEPTPNPTSPPEPAGLSQGFTSHCSSCHGRDGNSGFAPKLGKVNPAITFEEYRKAVRDGLPGRMPDFGEEKISNDQLANDQRWFEIQPR